MLSTYTTPKYCMQIIANGRPHSYSEVRPTAKPLSDYLIYSTDPQIHRSIPAVFGHPDPVHLLFVEETIMENCRETSSQPIKSGCMILSY